METGSDDQQLRREVRRQVRGIRAFYIHATIYAAVMVMLIMINISSGDAWRGNWWVQWPAMSWGTLLLIHGILALRGNSLFGPDWEERKIEEIMRQRKP